MRPGIRELIADDWPEVREIYEAGIRSGHATFETTAPPWPEWDADHRPDCRLVAEGDDGAVVGWAALSPVSSRCVYGGVAEVSVYLAPAARGQGLGRRLLAALVAASEAAGVWTLEAGIFPENDASLAIHMQCGFRLVGVREGLGRMGDTWRDVALLERRSEAVGT